MKLMTKEISKQLPSYDNIRKWKSEDEVIAYAHYFLCGFDWYLVAGSPVIADEDGNWGFTKNEDEATDWLLHVKGFSRMCQNGEYGDMLLSELEQYSVGSFIKVERETGWKPKPINKCN